MSLLVRKIPALQILRAQKVVGGVQARFDHWYPDYKPGPYPKTKEEWDAAAKKYNLLPEEYEPYPNDGFGYGDYPKLEYQSVCARDPYHNWDDEELRRDYMDPVQVRIINLLPEGDPADYPWSKIATDLLKYHIIPVLSVGFVGYLLHQIYFSPAPKKQYPKPGVVHYTFELDYDKVKSK